MQHPKVSVIVPNYNHCRYLAERLDSILNQTFGDFELIVLDDASTDASHEVLARYFHQPRVQIFMNARNTGSAFSQWNRGISLAKGEYIWIAESDDSADPRFLETMVPLLDTQPSVGLAYCQSILIDRNNRELGTAASWTADLHPSRWTSDFVASGVDEVRSYLVRKNTVPNASAVLCRRSTVTEVFPVDATYRLCGDWLHWAKVLLRSDVAYVARALNFWRTETSNSRPLPPGLLEWEEGQRVVAWVADALEFDDRQRTDALLNFARRCLDWSAASARAARGMSQATDAGEPRPIG
jgi:glycosyltransferase involved in cell wall biosynthesis